MGFERKPIALSRARTQTLGTAILFQSKNFWLSPHSLSESGGYQPGEIRNTDSRLLSSDSDSDDGGLTRRRRARYILGMPRTLLNHKTSSSAGDILKTILDEVRLLRDEIRLVLPYEDLNEYAHPNRIKRSYQKAVKRYPPAPA